MTPSGGSLGGNLNTDANGAVSGSFAIPDPTVDANPRWRTGTKVFRLTSSSTNADISSSATATSAEADYVARGLQETVRGASISTREARTVRTARTENRTIARTVRQTAVRNRDPLAQSFIIDETDGCFISSLTAFFASKSSTIPVRAEIREMENGYPTKTILPFAQKYLNPSSVNTSTDASSGTVFTFPSPVYLKEGTEYCFVLYSDSSDYTAYVSRLGGTVIGSDRKVSEQPNSGVLFKSANMSTWEPDQMEDIKFTLKKAVFDTSTSGTVTLANKALPTRTLGANPLRTFNGTGIIRVFHKNHGMHSTTKDNVTISGVSSGSYNGIAHSAINGTYTSISNITLDSYDITTAGTATSSGDVGGSSVVATENRAFDVAQLQIGTLNLPATSLSGTLKTTTGKSVHGTETPFTLDTTASNTVLQDNIYFTSPRLVASSINEANEMTGKSLVVNLTMSSTNANLSPVIDLKRTNVFVINNRLNNPTVSSTDRFTGDGSTRAFTLSGSPSSVHLLAVKKNGLKLQPVDDFTVSGTTLTMGSAPASGASLVVKLSNTVDFEEDTAVEGGSSEGSYITKTVNLTNSSTALDIRVAASVRSSSSIKAFFRVSGGEETRRIKDIEFTPFNTDGSPDTAIDPSIGDEVLDNDFKDHKFSVSNVQEFTSFEIKIVLKGTVSPYAPRLKDFRGIALAV